MMSAIDMPRSRWTKPRVARMAYLRGRGYDPKEIAEDPLVQSTPAVVRRYIGMLGLSFGDARTGLCIDLPLKATVVLDIEAKARGQTKESLLEQLVKICVDDRHLFKNILDE